VTYGFGSHEEIEAARPDFLCHTPGGIDGLLRGDAGG
jgi:hypothetical protein